MLITKKKKSIKFALYFLLKETIVDLYQTFFSPLKQKGFMFLLSIILILSSFSQLINEIFYRFPHSHQIFTASYLKIFLLMSVIRTAIKTIHPQMSLFLLFTSYILLLLSLSNFVTNGIIITPFNLIDSQLQHIDQTLHFNSLKFISSIQHFSLLNMLSWRIYFSLIIFFFMTPLILFLMKHEQEAYSLLNHLLLSVLLAGLFYYFFPSTGPATLSQSTLYTQLQHSIYYSFQAIHASLKIIHHNYPFLSAPSIHTIWALLIAYACRKILYLNEIIFIWTTLVILTTLTTGWHFLTDVLLGISFTGLIIYLNKKITTLFLHP